MFNALVDYIVKSIQDLEKNQVEIWRHDENVEQYPIEPFHKRICLRITLSS